MELTYDRTGNDTADAAAGNSYLYDAEGRSALHDLLMGTMTGYIYDAEGTRVAKGNISALTCDIKSNGFQPVSDYVIGPGGEQLTETGSDGQGNMVWSHTNVFAAGSLIGTYDKDGLHFYLNDWLGNRRVQTDYAGVFEQSCTNLPFGDSLNCTASLVSPTEHHFTGKERDVESGNDYFEARYYASAIGRFLTPDWSVKVEPVPYASLGDPQSLNLYAYVRNSPLSEVDPDGHCCWDWIKQHVASAAIGALKGVLTLAFAKPLIKPGPEVRTTETVTGIHVAEDTQAQAQQIQNAVPPALQPNGDTETVADIATIVLLTTTGVGEDIEEAGAAAAEVGDSSSTVEAGGGLKTPGSYFGEKSADEAKAALEAKFGPAKSSRPGADTYFDAKNGRSYNVHTDPAHGASHVDIRKRGPTPDRKVPLKEDGQ